MSDPRLSAALDRIDEAVVDPALWASALDSIADLVGAGGSSILSRVQSVGVWTRVDPAARRLFYDRFIDNPIQNAMRQMRWGAGGNAPPVLTDRHLVDRSVFTRTAYYNEFMAPHDADASIVVDLALGENVGALNMSCSKKKGGFSTDDIGLMTALRPHLARSLWLGAKLWERRREQEGVDEVFERSPCAFFLIAEGGRVARLNRAAEALIAEPDGLTIQAGRLGARAPDANRRLQALIAFALSLDGGAGSTAMSLPTPGRRRPLAISIAPVRAPSFDHLGGWRAVLLSASDMDADLSPSETRLREFFGFTAAERRVALALYDGQTPREAAEKLGLSFYTVRSHLARMFAKTDTRSQTELVRLLMRTIHAGEF